MSFASQVGVVLVKKDLDVLLRIGGPEKKDAQECELGKDVQDMLEDSDCFFSSDQIH